MKNEERTHNFVKNLRKTEKGRLFIGRTVLFIALAHFCFSLILYRVFFLWYHIKNSFYLLITFSISFYVNKIGFYIELDGWKERKKSQQRRNLLFPVVSIVFFLSTMKTIISTRVSLLLYGIFTCVFYLWPIRALNEWIWSELSFIVNQ